MKKLCTILFAATMTAALGFPGTAAAAATGWPTGCSNSRFADGNGWQAHCRSSNGGHYKATAICKPLDGGPLITRDAGAWQTSQVSYAFCPPMTFVTSGGIIERSY